MFGHHVLDGYSNKHKKLPLIGDFNVRMIDSSMKEFHIFNGLKDLMKKPICFKNSDKSACTCQLYCFYICTEAIFSDRCMFLKGVKKEYFKKP